MKIAVLMYHEVTPDSPSQRYAVQVDRFAQHICALNGAGFKCVSVGDARSLSRTAAPPPMCCLTFDDGYESDALRVLPILRDAGATATFFVTTGRVESSVGAITWKQIEELHAMGMEIGCHGHTHRFLDGLPDAEMMDELIQSRLAIANVIGRPPISMSLPGGRGSEKVLESAISLGFESIATSVPRCWNPLSSGVLGRFVVTRDSSEKLAVQLARRNASVLLRRSVRYSGVRLIRRWLGDAKYHQYWSRTLRE